MVINNRGVAVGYEGILIRRSLTERLPKILKIWVLGEDFTCSSHHTTYWPKRWLDGSLELH